MGGRQPRHCRLPPLQVCKPPTCIVKRVTLLSAAVMMVAAVVVYPLSMPLTASPSCTLRSAVQSCGEAGAAPARVKLRGRPSRGGAAVYTRVPPTHPFRLLHNQRARAMPTGTPRLTWPGGAAARVMSLDVASSTTRSIASMAWSPRPVRIFSTRMTCGDCVPTYWCMCV